MSKKFVGTKVYHLVDGVRVPGLPNRLLTRDDVVIEELHCGPSMTQQHYLQETDINTILKRHGVVDIGGNVQFGAEFFRDTSFDKLDLLEASELVNDANAAFESLPSSVRSKVNNSLKEFVELDVKARDELIEQALRADAQTRQAAPQEQPVPAAAPSETKPQAN